MIRMEIEAKFRVEHADFFETILNTDVLGSFQLTCSEDIEEQYNRYFDTADGRLRAQAYGLRIREIGDRRIVTLKGKGAVKDGLHQRDEWEVEIGREDAPEHWPPGEVRDRVLQLLDGTALVTTLAINTSRQHIFASTTSGPVAEISLDVGTFIAGDVCEPFRECEVELLPEASREDFEQLVTELQCRFNLIPENRSKLARGLALLER
ncbi:MAG: CYTH and CHAD domain-containing protein [Chloroflexi bacterium AL-W]|nr:CYTH and CHAD domain-containing protein [Chloroflexi bacterium AL-N1]NOK70271.1 CYTH and CHAD domain-containing protein [Chloroflexi bacterium AL-N10]NOK77808.1 CYTH and CHAD domain-containing protein [Chloroflexi bacterium AL-N5]NOK84817.1 CYTH and CHAD domain-containing protein [Chloroflexi bacterium AL-W]NOK92424.1 CYTH and CHAD domain-containing protein [Chloroflexi bacterium AL-N15]